MLEAGVRVFEYQPALLHAKTVVADGIRSIIGTISFDNRSLAFNSEIALVAADRTLGAELERQFDADLAHARRIELTSFRRRSLRHRILERSSDLLWRWV